MKLQTKILAPLALMGLAAAGCTTPPRPPLAMSFAGQNCAAAPDLSAAVSLTPEKERHVHTVSTDVNAETPCVLRDGVAVPYVVYALPAEHADKTVIVGSPLQIDRIFAPNVEILDEAGNVSRQFERDAYFFRGSTYSVQFRPRQTERYVLVVGAPDMVGQSYDAIQIGVNYTTISTGMMTMVMTNGTETSNNRTFTYDGSVSVLVNDTEVE